jgi:hypothetical protein
VETLLDYDVWLRELLCVRLAAPRRAALKAMRERLHAGDGLTLVERIEIKRTYRRYRKQVALVQEARDRARRTNGSRQLGLSAEEVAKRVAARKRAQEDLGI